MRKVVVANYSEDWPKRFEKESARIHEIFGEELADIHPIGSTSVPGLSAKPIIDIMPVVRKIERVDRFNGQMESLGYECMGELGIPGRRFFRKGGDNRTYHVHVFQEDNHHDIDRHLAVRDYLRAHPEEARKYGELKTDLAAQFPTDIEAYIDGKDSFVKALEAKALAWYREQSR